MRWLLAIALLAVGNVAWGQSRWDVTITAATGPLATSVGQVIRVPASTINPFFPTSPSIHGGGSGAGGVTASVYAYQAELPHPTIPGRYFYDASQGASWVVLSKSLGGTAYSAAGVPYTPSVMAQFRTTPWQPSFGGSGTYAGGTFTVSVVFVP